MNAIEQLIQRADHLITRLESLLPPPPAEPDWQAVAWRWVKHNGHGQLQAVAHPHQILLDDIRFIDRQKNEVVRNTRQFLQSLPANHVLLTGARGTGKSSLVKAVLNAYASEGLRLIEVEKQDLTDLPQITQLIRQRPEKFIIFCDDLTFEAHDLGYKALKVILDGSIENASSNLLVYATSNRKNLMPEYMADNQPILDQGEIRQNDTIDEKTSLAERFGLWLSFYSFDQDEYLNIAAHWLKTFGIKMDDAARHAALQFYHTRGARSGRVAYQFAKDYAGQLQLKS
ncbi:ATP-binding protein [Methylophilus sp. 3sh_L]|uniref:ATP-binding protein n=1 Tax=Methylophilus sp. 3sh_L TaxID=3377114 RepID=UPI00398E4E10